jgi:hypothetical protein
VPLQVLHFWSVLSFELQVLFILIQMSWKLSEMIIFVDDHTMPKLRVNHQMNLPHPTPNTLLYLSHPAGCDHLKLPGACFFLDSTPPLHDLSSRHDVADRSAQRAPVRAVTTRLARRTARSGAGPFGLVAFFLSLATWPCPGASPRHRASPGPISPSGLPLLAPRRSPPYASARPVTEPSLSSLGPFPLEPSRRH